MSPDTTCILYLAHVLSPSVLKEYEKLKECRRFGFDVKLLYDNSKHDFPYDKFGDDREYSLFSLSSLEKEFVLKPYSKKTPFFGNSHFPILSFARSHSYTYIWRIEYDVRFTGPWSDFFRAWATSDSDLLGTTLCRYNTSPNWNWWNSATVNGAPIADQDLIRGFFPIMRLSQKACTVLHNAAQQGWQGHFEVMVGTILHHFNCRIEDLGGDGEFVQSENRNRFYSNTPQHNTLWPGTFVWRMPEVWYEHAYDIQGYLYHPVKEKTWYQNAYGALMRRLHLGTYPNTHTA